MNFFLLDFPMIFTEPDWFLQLTWENVIILIELIKNSIWPKNWKSKNGKKNILNKFDVF